MPKNSEPGLRGWRLIFVIVTSAVLIALALAVGWYLEQNEWLAGFFALLAIFTLLELVWELAKWAMWRFRSRT